MTHFAQRAAVHGFASIAALVMVGSAALGCGDASEMDGALPLVTIVECEQMGGAPMFDPEDERPLELSCPDGLEAIAEFDEAFFGSHGGVCCTSSEAAAAQSP